MLSAGPKDDPTHSQLRQLVAGSLRPGNVQALVPVIRESLHELAMAGAASGRLDVIKDVATELPFRVVANAFGIKPEERAFVRQRADVMRAAATTRYNPMTYMSMMEVLKAAKELQTFFNETLMKRDPPGILMKPFRKAAQASDGPKHLDAEVLWANFVTLLLGGYETTTNLIGASMRGLLSHPDELVKVRNAPSSRPALKEAVRWDSPAQIVERRAAVDTHIGDVRVPKGTIVLVGIGPGNRDETVYADPDRMNASRFEEAPGVEMPPDPLSFGAKRHGCPGELLGIQRPKWWSTSY